MRNGTLPRHTEAPGIDDETIRGAEHATLDGLAPPGRTPSSGLPSGDGLQADGDAFLRILADTVAHEVRNPLTAILGYVELAERDGGGSEWIRGIRSEVRRIDGVVRELYDLAGPSRDGAGTVDLNELVTDVAAELGHEAGAPLADVRMVLELGRGIPAVTGDPDQLECALEKVLLEAGEAVSPDRSAPAGRIVVITRPAEGVTTGAVTVTITAEGERSEADAADGNPGSGDATDERDGLRGLVLALTRQSVEKVDGTIEVERLSASSVRYVVTLPASRSGVLADGNEPATSKEERTIDEHEQRRVHTSTRSR